MCGNILSTIKISEKGYGIHTVGQTTVIDDQEGKVIAVAHQHGKAHYLFEKIDSAQEKCQQEANQLTMTKDTDIAKWHQRFSHLHYGAVRKVIDIPTSQENPLCETCILGKMTAKPFPSKGTRAEKTLQLIHSDVMDLHPATSRNGERYAITFIDDFTRFGMTYFAKTKDEVMKTFLEYKALAENQQGTSIKVLRSDRGGEYMSKDFDNFLHQNGIIHQLTVAHTPQQNGVAERRNRTLTEATRCLLIQSGCSIEHWADAMAHATYTRNRSPSRSIQGNTPYEMWFKKKPSYEHFRSFGCEAWYRITHRRTKLEPKSAPCIMLGYAPTSKACILWDQRKGTTVTARDIVFNEANFPAKSNQPKDVAIHPDVIMFALDEESDEESESESELSASNEPTEENHDTSFEDNVFESAESTSSDKVEPFPRPPVTRAGRQTRPTIWRKDYELSLSAQASENEQDPRTFNQAMRSSK